MSQLKKMFWQQFGDENIFDISGVVDTPQYFQCINTFGAS
jgi:hypothetical protein